MTWRCSSRMSLARPSRSRPRRLRRPVRGRRRRAEGVTCLAVVGGTGRALGVGRTRVEVPLCFVFPRWLLPCRLAERYISQFDTHMLEMGWRGSPRLDWELGLGIPPGVCLRFWRWGGWKALHSQGQLGMGQWLCDEFSWNGHGGLFASE